MDRTDPFKSNKNRVEHCKSAAAAVNRTDGRPGKRRRAAIVFRVSAVPTTGRKYCRRRLFGFYRYLNEASAHTTDRRRRRHRRCTLNVVLSRVSEYVDGARASG